MLTLQAALLSRSFTKALQVKIRKRLTLMPFGILR